MATEPVRILGGLYRVGLEEVRKKAGWFIALGILLIILGTVAIGSSVLMTMATMVFLGWLMIVGGVLEAVHSFGCKEWGGFFVDLLTGILYAVAGTMIASSPGVSAVALTLFISLFLIFGGIYRMVIAIAVRFPHWGWLMLHGLIDLLLGVSIWLNWPLSGLWVIGLFVGIDMILNGWSLVMLGAAMKSIPREEKPA